MATTEINENDTKELYKSRAVILDCLKKQGFDVKKYENFSIHEVYSMYQAKQMDMLIVNPNNGKQTYIKYHTGKSEKIEKGIRPTNIYQYVEDIFTMERLLKEETDDLIIIVGEEMNETTEKTLNHIWEQDGIFVNVINIDRLQYNILNHELVPKHTVLTHKESEEFRQKFNITNDKQIPDISRFGPVSQLIGIRPGNICKIIRPSKTAISTEFYRICTI